MLFVIKENINIIGWEQTQKEVSLDESLLYGGNHTLTSPIIDSNTRRPRRSGCLTLSKLNCTGFTQYEHNIVTKKF